MSCKAATTSPATSRFHGPESAMAQAQEFVVRLHFTNINHPDLFVHSYPLRTWSKVLANLMEDASNSPLKGTSANGQFTIPLDDTDAVAWENVLRLMHPTNEPFDIAWENATGLLELAGKYDMPAISGADWGCVGREWLNPLAVATQKEHGAVLQGISFLGGGGGAFGRAGGGVQTAVCVAVPNPKCCD